MSPRKREYDEDDVNLVTWRFPAAIDGPADAAADGAAAPAEDAEAADEDDGEDDAEARAAVDRVLKKYEKAPIEDKDAEGTFDERHARSIKEKMEEWKRGYYQVRFWFFTFILPSSALHVAVLILYTCVCAGQARVFV